MDNRTAEPTLAELAAEMRQLREQNSRLHQRLAQVEGAGAPSTGRYSQPSEGGEPDRSPTFSRRGALMALGGAAGGLGLVAGSSLLGASPASASEDGGTQGGALILGDSGGNANSASSSTQVITSAGVGLAGATGQTGQSGMEGQDLTTKQPYGYGVTGTSDGGTGVQGLSTNGTGVFGTSGQGTGVYGQAGPGTGVLGTSAGGAGVKGQDLTTESPYAQGVTGTSDGGIGVYGVQGGGSGLGESTGGAIIGDAFAYAGVVGLSSGSDGVYGVSSAGKGWSGVSGYDASGTPQGSGMAGDSEAGAGVIGTADSGFGVFGASTSGVGTYGQTGGGGQPGVQGVDASLHGAVGVLAVSVPGVALQVRGSSQFSTCGTATVAGTSTAPKSAVTVTGVALTDTNVVLATPQGTTGGAVTGVVLDVSANKFTIHLTKAVTADLVIAWFILGPGPQPSADSARVPVRPRVRP